MELRKNKKRNKLAWLLLCLISKRMLTSSSRTCPTFVHILKSRSCVSRLYLSFPSVFLLFLFVQRYHAFASLKISWYKTLVVRKRGHFFFFFFLSLVVNFIQLCNTNKSLSSTATTFKIKYLNYAGFYHYFFFAISKQLRLLKNKVFYICF